MIRQHVPDPPTLVGPAILQVLPQVRLDLFILELTADGDEVGDGQQPHAILVVGREALVERDDLGFEESRLSGEGLGIGLSTWMSAGLRPIRSLQAPDSPRAPWQRHVEPWEYHP